MPDVGMSQPSAAMRERVLASLAELVSGGMAERMRRDAATRVLVTARRLMALTASGYGLGERPGGATSGPAAGADARLVTELAAAWDPEALTAAEFVEGLAPAELDALLAAARPWATRVWHAQLSLPEAEKHRRLAAA